MKCPAVFIDRLDAEANRYRDLAKDLALGTLIEPNPEKERKAREHLLRAETFKAAAALLVQPTA